LPCQFGSRTHIVLGLSICDHILKVCEHNILQTDCGNYQPIYNQCAVRDKDELYILRS